MATLVLGVVGSFFGPVGSMIGAMIGGIIDRMIMSSLQKPTVVHGPRISDSAVMQAQYGGPIPICAGTVRVAGNIIWASPLIESANRQKQKGGKGGGGSKTETVTYTYFRHAFLAFCDTSKTRALVDVPRLWGDGKLFYNNGAQQTCAAVRIKTGDFAQLPDSVIQSYDGVSVTPAYVGIGGVFLDRMALADFGNRLPQIQGEVSTGVTNAADFCATLMRMAGVTRFFVDSLASSTIRGFTVGQNMTYRAALDAFLTIFSANGVSRADGLHVIRRDKFALRGIDDTEMGAGSNEAPDGDAVQMRRIKEADIPREVVLKFFDPALDLQINAVRAFRDIGNSKGKAIIELPAVLTVTEAQQLVETALFGAHTKRMSADRITLLPEYMELQPGEMVDMKILGRMERCRISKVAIGADRLVAVAVGFEDSAQFVSEAAGTPTTVPGQEAGEAPDTLWFLLDMPILREPDDDPAFYVAFASVDPAIHRGAALWRSADNADFTDILTIPDLATTGVCAAILATGPTDIYDDTNTLIVDLDDSDLQLVSATRAEVDAGTNWCVVGTEATGWEVLGFKTAQLVAPGRYHLSGLLRGRRGTEWRIATHGAAEKFIMLGEGAGFSRTLDGSALWGQSLYYRAVTVNQEVGDVVSTTFTNTGVAKKPFSPWYLRGNLASGTGDITISWERRTRIPVADFAAAFPMEEQAEKYRLRIMNGGSPVRTVEIADVRTFVYTAAMQTTDFGSLQATYTIKVEQRGYGDMLGYEATGTIPQTAS